MRIGTKLLATSIALILLVAAATLLVAPRWVTRVVTTQEQQRLQSQAEAVARQMTNRLKVLSAVELGRVGLLEGSRSIQNTLRLVDAILTDELVAVVGPEGTVLDANLPELRRARIPLDAEGSIQVEGVGSVLTAVAPIQVDGRATGLSVVMLHHVRYIEALTEGLTRWILLIILVILLFAMVVVGWVSRELVRRLQQTGEAARALAEGDLGRRAPTTGRDEITELAGHFNHMAERIQTLVEGLHRSEDSRRALLAIASHEIRTPLTSIQGFAEALRDGLVTEEERRERYYEIIATESSRLSQMVEDLFDAAKLEAGQAELRLQEMAVGPWLTAFAESYPVGLEVAVTPAAAASRLYGDQDRLRQVLSNLVGNAARYTPEGELVRVEALTEGDQLLVRVVDKGPGLAPDEAERVFARFYQGPNQGRGHKGAGLGLAIVKLLVEAHGGAVGVESVVGQGATFWFRLKLLPGAGE